MKKVLVLTIGSRGDVQPYVALAKGFISRGYIVMLASLSNFADLASEAGLEFVPLDAGISPILNAPEIRRALGTGLERNIFGVTRAILPVISTILDNAWNAAQGVDLVIFQPLAFAGNSIAEKLEIPGVLALPSPMLSPTAAFPSPYLPVPANSGWLNRLSHRLVIGASLPILRWMINSWRKKRLSLGPAGDLRFYHGQHLLKLYGYSAHILPVPPDWDASSQVTGFWFLDHDGWQTPQDLVHFLDSGPPPVFVGFGSVVARDPDRLTWLVLQAGQMVRQRLVLASNWGDLSRPVVSKDVYFLESAPYDWLFPRMAAVVHHGGAGTLAAGLRAGKPTITCPFTATQLFWARRVVALGAGPEIIPHRRLTAERLAEAISLVVNNQAFLHRASELGGLIQQEDGVGNAVDVIEAYVKEYPNIARPI